MKKCSEIKELISLYIDDELEQEQRRELEAHTSACEECRNELDELMQIVGLCRDIAEEELPANFKAELHQKLLEAKEQSEVVKKPAFYQSKYFRLFSSVAAVFLLVFLIRGVTNFDLFTGVSKNSANDMNKMLAETRAGNMAQMESADAALDTYGIKGNQRVGGYNEGKKGDAEAPAAGTDIDRSSVLERENKMHLAAGMVGEIVTRNSASITIAVDDPELQAEKVRQAAIESFGMDSGENETADDNYIYLPVEEGVILQLSVPNVQYGELVSALARDYGQDNVQTEGVVSEDMTTAVEDLLSEVDRLDVMIEDAENDNGDNEEELAKIREEKAEIQSRIDLLRLESDLTNVEIKLKKK